MPVDFIFICKHTYRFAALTQKIDPTPVELRDERPEGRMHRGTDAQRDGSKTKNLNQNTRAAISAIADLLLRRPGKTRVYQYKSKCSKLAAIYFGSTIRTKYNRLGFRLCLSAYSLNCCFLFTSVPPCICPSVPLSLSPWMKLLMHAF